MDHLSQTRTLARTAAACDSPGVASATGQSLPASGQAGAQQPATEQALWSIGAHVRFWGVAAAGLAVDLWSKQWAFHTLRQGGRWIIIPHMLEFQTMLNPGALFGIGSGQTTLFLLASLLALGLVLWMFARSPARRWGLHLALAGILAGALGNMYDRVFVRLVERPVASARGPIYLQQFEENGRIIAREYPPDIDGIRQVLPQRREEAGFVRDFIKIPTSFLRRELWPWVFNVADVLLVVGVGFLAVHLWRGHRDSAGPASAGAP